MTATTTPTLVRVDDREGEGRCDACEREGLRWVCVLSDGTEVGTECAKAALGYKPTPKAYAWVADYAPVSEYREGNGASAVTWTLYAAKTGNATRATRDGVLVMVGGAMATWQQRGWL